MPAAPDLSLAEWVVLALVAEHPTHGFAVASLTGADGAVGSVWSVPRPVVYRSLSRLEEAGLVEAVSVEPGKGPQRVVYDVTRRGRSTVTAWLEQPVQHVRDVRSHLLVKLALLDRRGQSSAALLTQQRDVLVPITRALGEHQDSATGFDAVLLAWRRTNADAALAFVDAILPRAR